MLFVNIIGWAGSVAVITAYFMISTNRTVGHSKIYQLLNLTGALCLMVNTAYYHAYPSALVNVVWSLIAVSALCLKVVRVPYRLRRRM